MFCESPWLLSIERKDLESADLCERIVVALIGAALAGLQQAAANLLRGLGAADAGRQRLPSALVLLLDAVIHHKTIRLADVDALKANSELRKCVEEELFFEGGKYRHAQCAKAHHFLRFENAYVFPALVDKWVRVQESLDRRQYDLAHELVDTVDVSEWYEELTRTAQKSVEDHPLYSVKIRDFMESFIGRLRNYIAGVERVWAGDESVVEPDRLMKELDEWAGSQQARKQVAELVKRAMSDRGASVSECYWEYLSQNPRVILRCPNFALWLRKQQEPIPDAEFERILYSDLSRDYADVDVVSVLKPESAWEYLCLFPEDAEGVADPSWEVKRQAEHSALTDARSRIAQLDDDGRIEAYDDCLAGNRLVAARTILEESDRRSRAKSSELRDEVSTFADEQLALLAATKDAAELANMPVEWLDRVLELSSEIERALRLFRRDHCPSAEAKADRTRLKRAVESFQFNVDHRAKQFDEISCLLDPMRGEQPASKVVEHEQRKVREECPQIYQEWDMLSRSTTEDDKQTRAAWSEFVKQFAKACNLYHDEHDKRQRFVLVCNMDYPFSVFETRFYRPQSEFLKAGVRLYLYRNNDIDNQALQRLEREVQGEDSVSWLHVVFAPEGKEIVKRYFKYDTQGVSFLIIDDDWLLRIMETKKHDIPLRRARHGAVPHLMSSSPFVAQGYCHENNNIYVGRKDILQKLLNTPQAMIWGGRRIGKTSVLHALQSSLSHHSRGYRVAYVYVDLQDDGDPDLAVAIKISSTLGLSEPATITEFERQITELRGSGVKLAFLIDEVDEYIKKSRAVHDDSFPLATTLRQLVMDDTDKETRLVYSGFHQFYNEAKLDRGRRRVGHPFVNITQDIPIKNLSLDDVRELVRTGFEDMLDIRVKAGVSELILQRASGLPGILHSFSSSAGAFWSVFRKGGHFTSESRSRQKTLRPCTWPMLRATAVKRPSSFTLTKRSVII